MSFRAVLFDLGGVVLTGPMEAFAAYESRAGLPDGLIRKINSTNPDGNAWARYERSEVDLAGFVELFEAEGRDLGYTVDARAVLASLGGEIRPEMVAALGVLREAGLHVAAATNNIAPLSFQEGPLAELAPLFDVVVQSSVERVRKPEPGFYTLALRRLEVAATECVFLDDLGVNLKPARSMGMTTLKVVDPAESLHELGELLELSLI